MAIMKVIIFLSILLILPLNYVETATISFTKAQIGSGDNTGCKIKLPVNRNFAPVITDQKTSEILLPLDVQTPQGGASYVTVGYNQKIKVNCGRGNALVEFDPFYYLLLYCVRETEFLNQHDEKVVIQEGSEAVECSNPLKASGTIIRNGTCAGAKGTNFDVKFLNESPPRKYYSICVDESISGTLFSSSYIDGQSFANGSAEGSGNRPDFRGQEFYPFPIKQAYKWQNAYDHLSDLLGSSDVVDDYFPSQQHRFSRGHLFPNGDGVKRFEKHATFYYFNTIPQWQLLNGGNWAIVEQDVRDFAIVLRRTFEVITGSYGVATLKDANNNAVDLYLAKDSSGKLRLPVPRVVWKVVYDPIGNAAVAIVQENNPWIKSRGNGKAPLCNSEDLCGRLSWLRSEGNFNVARKGITYCCDVKELRKVIRFLPEIHYKSVLGEGFSGGHGNTEGSDDYDDEEEEDEDDEEEDEEEEEEDDESSSDDKDSSEES